MNVRLNKQTVVIQIGKLFTHYIRYQMATTYQHIFTLHTHISYLHLHMCEYV